MSKEHAINNKLTNNQSINTFSSSSSEVTVEQVDQQLKEKHNHIPADEFENIKIKMLQDETATVETVNQYQALLDYRLSVWKPKVQKQSFARKSQSKKQEHVPEWFPQHKEQVAATLETVAPEPAVDFEKERQKILQKLKG